MKEARSRKGACLFCFWAGSVELRLAKSSILTHAVAPATFSRAAPRHRVRILKAQPKTAKHAHMANKIEGQSSPKDCWFCKPINDPTTENSKTRPYGKQNRRAKFAKRLLVL
ncbi:MAG: hypothetical protein IJX68_04385 [Rikenellaceae bacterium]|nr:hypothetical protein [Rikenellaceae bacterium]